MFKIELRSNRKTSIFYAIGDNNSVAIQSMMLLAQVVSLKKVIMAFVTSQNVILAHVRLHVGNPIMKHVLAPVPSRLRSAAKRRVQAASVVF